MYQKIIDELHRLANDKEFMEKWHKLMQLDLPLYERARYQENLIALSSDLFGVLKIQRESNRSNLKNGDLYVPEYNLFIDLKVSSPQTADNYCGVVNESSLLGFKEAGWYLCINRAFTKYAFFPKSELLAKYNNNNLIIRGTEPHRYIPSFQYKILDI